VQSKIRTVAIAVGENVAHTKKDVGSCGRASIRRCTAAARSR